MFHDSTSKPPGTISPEVRPARREDAFGEDIFAKMKGRGMVRVTGTLTCGTAADVAVVAPYLPDHIALSLAEPGCLRFEVVRDGPMVWRLDEAFVDRAAFEAHQARTKGSVWFAVSQGLTRDFRITES